MFHNTIVNTKGDSGSAIEVVNHPVHLANNIISGYATPFSPAIQQGLPIEHNLLVSEEGGGVVEGGNILATDALFVAPSNGDFRLQGESPARDSGKDVGVLIDLVGVKRPFGTGFDMGAHEFNGGNRPPNAADNRYTMVEATALTVAAPGILGNDSDTDGDTLLASLVADANAGHLTLNSDGSFVYIPDANFVGHDSFVYQANDGLGNDAATVTIEVISIEAVNNRIYLPAIKRQP